jgi:hypothetical protein
MAEASRSIGGATQPPDRLLDAFVLQSAGCAAFFFAYHLALRYWLSSRPLALATVVARHAVPLYAGIERPVALTAWILPAVVVLGAFVFTSPRLVRPELPRLRALALSALLFPAIGVAVGLVDGWFVHDGRTLPRLVKAYTNPHLEYYQDVPKVEKFGGPAGFVARYAKPTWSARLSLHPSTHPPGGILFLWLAGKLFGRGYWTAALATIGFTALTLPPVYLLARELHGEGVARYALVLFLVTPSVVLFTTTSMDGPFSVPLVWSVFLFYRAARPSGEPATGRWRALSVSAAAGLVFAAALFMTYSAFCLGLILAASALLAFAWDARLARGMILSGAVMFFVACACYLLLHAALGFDLVTAFRTAYARHKAIDGLTYRSMEHYLLISTSQLAAFFIGVGAPVAVLWFRRLVRALRADPGAALGDVYARGFGLALLLISFSTLYAMEVERIWIFMAPFVVVPAAQQLHEICRRSGHARALRWTTAMLSVQIVLFELTLDTRW